MPELPLQACTCVLPRANARDLRPEMLPWAPDLATCDLSFISIGTVWGAVVRCLAPGWRAMVMVKPQFEVGRERVGKGGVVRSADERRAALVSVGEFARSELGLSLLGYASSGLPGPAGNRESFVWVAEAGREGALDDVEAAARRAEP